MIVERPQVIPHLEGKTSPPVRADWDDGKYSILDGLRGLAALLIVLRHAKGQLVPFQFPESYIAVDLFFLMSGFVIAKSYERKLFAGTLSFRSFMTLRVIRLYPLYLVGLFLGVISLSLEHYYSPASVNTPNYVATSAALALLMLPAPFRLSFPVNGPSWSLFFEMAANIAYGALAPWLKTRRLMVVTAISFVLMVCGVVLHKTLDFGWSSEGFLYGFARVGFSFSLGVLLFRFQQSARVRNNWIALAVVAAAGLSLCVSVADGWDGVYALAIVAFLFPLLVWLGTIYEPTGATRRVFFFGGVTSYALYVLHQPLIHISDSLISNIEHVRTMSFYPWTLLIVPLVVGVAVLMDAYYDRVVRKFLLSRCSKDRVNYNSR